MPKVIPYSSARVLKNQWGKQKSGLVTPNNLVSNFSRQGLVLYADLWHPDQQAIGSLINGTGIATEAPATLAIGNNTINVTTQGTFIVYVRGSGTATSGTATVVGSVVTLISGHNTVTVTGTGTITIALNNVLTDKSGNGHLMTVTGAVWGSQGRTFDGNDDVISAPDHASLDITTTITLEAWFKHDGTVATQPIVHKWTTWPSAVYGLFVYNGTRLFFEFYSGGVRKNLDTAGYLSLVADTWNYGAGVYDGTNQKIYVNGVLSVSSNIGSFAIDTNNLNVRIGRDTTYLSKGLIGEVRIYNRALSATEIQRIYLATKWRYV